MFEFVCALLLGLCSGGLAGAMAALAGVGGGLVYFPVLLWFLPSDTSVAVLVFCSLCGVLITASASACAHWRLQHVHRASLVLLLPVLMLAASLGLWLSLLVDTVYLLTAMALFNAWVALDMYKKFQLQPLSLALPILAFPIGLVSGLFGLGGGSMLTPMLRRYLSLRLAVATASFCGASMALAALLSNALLEPDWWQLWRAHAPLLGFFLLGVALSAPKASAYFAKQHGLCSERRMRYVLCALFACISLAYGCRVYWLTLA